MNTIKRNAILADKEAIVAETSINADAAPRSGDTLRQRELLQVVAQLKREGQTYVLRMLGCVVCCTLSVALLIAAVAFADPNGPPIGLMLGCLACLVCGGALMPPTRSRVLEAWKDRLAPDIIGPLLDALATANGETAGQIQALLTKLLPRLRPTDAAALTPRQRRRLRDALLLGDADCNPAYLQAVVQTLAQCADEQTLACLRQMVQRGAITDRQQWVLDAVWRCLPDVEAQIAARQSGADLLRASSPARDPVQLLRAAQSAPDAAPDTLLRADNSPK